MTRMSLLGAACLTLVAATAFGQAKVAFEVASIRPTDSELPAGARVGFQATGSQVRIGAMSIKDLLGIAYTLRPQQIEGPDWLGQQRWDVSATIPDGVPTSKVPDMLAALLVERFQLKFHREMRELPVYALGTAKAGAKVIESAPDPNAPAAPPDTVNVVGGGTGAGVSLDLGNGSSFTLANNKVQIRRMTMFDIAETLTRFVDRPVVDRTGLTKTYDLTLDLTPEEYGAILIRSAVNAGVQLPPQAMRLLDAASPDTLSSPLSRFGLTFDARREPLDVLVVDSSSKTPTEN
jgi:uncharacterized protein (TIGR03435 family)